MSRNRRRQRVWFRSGDRGHIRAAGSAAGEVADGVRPIEVDAVAQAAQAIPGAKAAGLFGQVEQHLASNLEKVAGGFAAFGNSLQDAADRYEHYEQHTAEELAVPGSGT